ncbi:MAG: hypothetical protein KKH72_01370 [Alphaproteobacteria bacterium]|nr:hypothetical protein [Alphaproteobacteria bacterium]
MSAGTQIIAVIGVLLGASFSLLGGLWFLQGADLVHIDPIACVAECEPLTGGSVAWMISGAFAILVGIGLISASYWWYRRSKRDRKQG